MLLLEGDLVSYFRYLAITCHIAVKNMTTSIQLWAVTAPGPGPWVALLVWKINVYL